MDKAELRREELIAHREFVRALARRLVLDPDKGDDVSQEALLAALESGTGARGPVRRWLSGIVKNLAYRMLRSEDRRRRREASRALPDRTRATGDVVADLELHREVVDALLGIEEPYRTTLLLHFFEYLPPREIAKRQGLPGATVRSHLKRGIERVRRSLDERHGGRAWCVALVPLAFPAKAGAPITAAAGVAVMSAKSKLSIAAVLLLTLAAIPVTSYWTARSASSEGSHRAAAETRSPASQVDEAGGASGAVAEAALAVEVRVLGPGDAPVADASVRVFAVWSGARREALGNRGVPWFQRDWRTALGADSPVAQHKTDANGLARLDLARATTVRVEATKAGLSRAERFVGGEPTVEIRLGPAHALKGLVLVDKKPAPGAVVAADAATLAAGSDFLDLPHRAVADGDGQYRLDSLPAGDLSLWAAHPGGVPSFVATVRVPDVGAFDILLPPAATLAGKVTEKGTGRPLSGFEVRVKVDRRPPAFGTAVTDAHGVYAMPSLPAGQVEGVHVSGPGYAQELPEARASWIRPQLSAGETTVHDIELVPVGAIHGTVRGPEGPIANLLVEAVCKVMFVELPAFTARTDGRGEYRIGNLPPARYLVRVDTFRLHEPGSGGDPLNPFESFQPGSHDQLVLVPSGGDIERSFVLEQNTAAIEGRVEDMAGSGLAGATVAAAGAKTESGPSGSFRLEGCRPGERVFVSVGLEGYRSTGISFVTLKPYETTEGVLLRLEPAIVREIVGRIHAADAAGLREPYVLVTSIRERKIHGHEPTRHAAAPDGTFRVPLNEWGWPKLTAVSLRAGDLGKGPSEPVRVELAGPARYEVDLFLTVSHGATGIVVGEDGKAVPGACVSLFPPREDVMRDQFGDPHANAPVVAVTGADGRFEARGLATGRYWWRVWAPGFSDSCGEVVLPAAEPMRIALDRALEIGGRVVTRDGKPVGSIHVWIQLPLPKEGNWDDEWWRHDLHRIHNLCANGRGEFRLGGLRKGDYRINIGGGSGGPNVVSKAFAGIPAGSTDLELVVEPGLSIEGRVVNAQGVGLEDVYLMARIEGREMVGGSRRSDRSGPDGGFVITGLEAGSYSIWMDVRRGSARREITREHFVAGSRDVVIEVDDTFATVSGTLVDGARKPFAGVRLRLVERDRWTENVAFTDAAGRFSFEAAGEGEYRVEVDRDERFESLLLEGGESVKGGDTNVVLRLHEGAPIEGAIRDEEGAPVAEAWVGATAGEISRAAKTDAQGRFRIVGVPERVEARVRATHKDFVRHLRRVPSGTSGVTITLLRGTVTTGRLVDASGAPLRGLRVRFAPVEGDDTEASARTDDDGRFEVRLLARDYRVTAERVGEDARVLSCGVVRGGGTEVQLTAK